MTNNTNIQWAIDILEDNMIGLTREERTTYLEDVASYGCISGNVGGTIHTHDINNLFKDNMEDILERITELNEETGCDVIQEAMENLDFGSDYAMFPTAAVWLIIEETAALLLSGLEGEGEAE